MGESFPPIPPGSLEASLLGPQFAQASGSRDPSSRSAPRTTLRVSNRTLRWSPAPFAFGLHRGWDGAAVRLYLDQATEEVPDFQRQASASDPGDQDCPCLDCKYRRKGKGCPIQRLDEAPETWRSNVRFADRKLIRGHPHKTHTFRRRTHLRELSVPFWPTE